MTLALLTLEWAAIGSLDRYIEIPEVVVMWRSSDPWCWIRNKTFCLLRVTREIECMDRSVVEVNRGGRVDVHRMAHLDDSLRYEHAKTGS